MNGSIVELRAGAIEISYGLLLELIGGPLCLPEHTKILHVNAGKRDCIEGGGKVKIIIESPGLDVLPRMTAPPVVYPLIRSDSGDGVARFERWIKS
jgi:hypothetical protein